jgi:hypothetical protein
MLLGNGSQVSEFCENLEYETQMGYKENLYWNTLWIAMELALTVTNELSKMIHWILFLTNEISSNWKCNHVHMSCFFVGFHDVDYQALCLSTYLFVHTMVSCI